MKKASHEIQSDPKAAVAAYIHDLEGAYYPWYESATNRNYYCWFIAQAISLLSGFGAALTAALLSERQFGSWSGGRVALVALPILGSLASTYLVQSRIADLEALRERGRETIQRLSSEARARFASIVDADEYTQLHLHLVDAVSKLESEQARWFRAIIPEQLTFSSQRNRKRSTREPKGSVSSILNRNTGEAAIVVDRRRGCKVAKRRHRLKSQEGVWRHEDGLRSGGSGRLP